MHLQKFSAHYSKFLFAHSNSRRRSEGRGSFHRNLLSSWRLLPGCKDAPDLIVEANTNGLLFSCLRVPCHRFLGMKCKSEWKIPGNSIMRERQPALSVRVRRPRPAGRGRPPPSGPGRRRSAVPNSHLAAALDAVAPSSFAPNCTCNFASQPPAGRRSFSTGSRTAAFSPRAAATSAAAAPPGRRGLGSP
jgi:hypothetical protein